MPFKTRRFLLSAVAALTGLGLARRGLAQVGSGGTGISPPASIGNAAVVIGAVTLRRPDEAPAPLENGGNLIQGDQIDTGDEAEVHFAFDDGGYLALRPNSSVRINRYVVTGEAADAATMTLLKGSLRSVTGWIGKLDPQRYRIFAGTATISVRGTDHEVVLVRAQDGLGDAEPGVHNRVNEGATVLRNAGSTVEVAQGAAAYAARDAAPRLHGSVPAFFNRLHTAQEARVQSHARDVQQHIEGRLRQLGRLNPGERFEQYRERVQSSRARRAEGGASVTPRSAAAGLPAQQGQQRPQQHPEKRPEERPEERQKQRKTRAVKEQPSRP